MCHNDIIVISYDLPFQPINNPKQYYRDYKNVNMENLIGIPWNSIYAFKNP